MTVNDNIYEELARAEQNAVIGSNMPSLNRLHFIKRVFYRPVIKLIFKISRIITVRQNKFNEAVLKILRRNAGMYYDFQLKTADETTRINKEISNYDTRIKQLESKMSYMEKNICYLKNMLTQINQKKVDYKIITSEKSEAEKKDFIKKIDSELDSLYVFLEDNLRGTRQEIKNRLKIYVPYIRRAASTVNNFSVLDIGCGRGEWIEILIESNIKATGIDLNSIMVKNCRELGFDVKKEDIMTYISKIKSESLGAVTAFHLIEHYGFEEVVFLFKEIFRILKPEGLAIFETPNPDNIVVGCNTFYLDPTHKNPVPSLLADLLIKACGFSDTEILNLNPVKSSEEKQKINGSIIETFGKYFFGPQDYAIIGYKK
jgi:O-antigen chain-terminating methyltransferase